jgi:5,6-dimethylbenzimidazole synthase
VPIAYLCVGHVSHFHDKPELEKAGWLPRLAFADLLYYDQWGETRPAQAEPLSAALTDLQTAIHQRGTFPA